MDPVTPDGGILPLPIAAKRANLRSRSAWEGQSQPCPSRAGLALLLVPHAAGRRSFDRRRSR